MSETINLRGPPATEEALRQLVDAVPGIDLAPLSEAELKQFRSRLAREASGEVHSQRRSAPPGKFVPRPSSAISEEDLSRLSDAASGNCDGAVAPASPEAKSRTAQRQMERHTGLPNRPDSETRKESALEFYARMEAEDRAKAAVREERLRQNSQQRLQEEEARKARLKINYKKAVDEVRLDRERIESERTERAQKMKQRNAELESDRQKQLAETKRQTDCERAQRENERQHRSALEESVNVRRREQDKIMELENTETIRKSIRQLELQKEGTVNGVACLVADQNAKIEEDVKRLQQEAAMETETQCLADLSAQSTKTIAAERARTVELIRASEASMLEKMQQLDSRMAQKAAEMDSRAQKLHYEQAEQDETRRRQEAVRAAEMQEMYMRYAATREQMQQDSARAEAAAHARMQLLQDNHAARVNALLLEEQQRMEEMKRRAREQDDARWSEWRKIMEQFENHMHQLQEMKITEDIERKWDDRFKEIRNATSPVTQAFEELLQLKLNGLGLEKFLLQYEADTASLRMSLSTLDDIILLEREQVEAWKKEQPGAFFLAHYGHCLADISASVELVAGELGRMDGLISEKMQDAQALAAILRMDALEESMHSLEQAAVSIPSVYELNKKYNYGTL